MKESDGIGTEATRGVILCQAVEGTLLSSPSMTAKWEEYLSKIGKGERTQQGFFERGRTVFKKTN